MLYLAIITPHFCFSASQCQQVRAGDGLLQTYSLHSDQLPASSRLEMNPINYILLQYILCMKYSIIHKMMFSNVLTLSCQLPWEHIISKISSS